MRPLKRTTFADATFDASRRRRRNRAVPVGPTCPHAFRGFLTRATRIDIDDLATSIYSYVVDHRNELSPRSVIDMLDCIPATKPVEILHSDSAEPIDDPARDLVCMITHISSLPPPVVRSDHCCMRCSRGVLASSPGRRPFWLRARFVLGELRPGLNPLTLRWRAVHPSTLL
jgi:hypothetical protein